MRILISGMSGFVGSNLSEIFKDDNEIYGLDLKNSIISKGNKCFSWDDFDNGKIPDYDAVIHLAGISHECKKKSDEQSYIDVNYGLTKRIFDSFLAGNAGVFVFFSSVKAVTDNVGEGVVLTEDVDYAPGDIYGRSKAMAEKYILDNMPGNESGKRVYILRPSMIYGPGGKGNLRLLYGFVKKGLPWPLGSYYNQRTFASIENVGFVVGSLLKSDVKSGIYNVCDDDNFSTGELLNLISGVVNKRIRVFSIPKVFVEAMAFAGSVFYLPFNRVRLKKLSESFIVSNVKIKSALGIVSMPVKAADGLKRAVESFN